MVVLRYLAPAWTLARPVHFLRSYRFNIVRSVLFLNEAHSQSLLLLHGLQRFFHEMNVCIDVGQQDVFQCAQPGASLPVTWRSMCLSLSRDSPAVGGIRQPDKPAPGLSGAVDPVQDFGTGREECFNSAVVTIQ
jgi:hypothetical protein